MSEFQKDWAEEEGFDPSLNLSLNESRIKREHKHDMQRRSFLFGWVAVGIFFGCAILIIIGFVLTLFFGKPALVDERVGSVFPYLAGMVFLTSSIGLTLAVAIFRYSFADDDKRHSSISDAPALPLANALSTAITEVIEFCKKKK